MLLNTAYSYVQYNGGVGNRRGKVRAYIKHKLYSMLFSLVPYSTCYKPMMYYKPTPL